MWSCWDWEGEGIPVGEQNCQANSVGTIVMGTSTTTNLCQRTIFCRRQTDLDLESAFSCVMVSLQKNTSLLAALPCSSSLPLCLCQHPLQHNVVQQKPNSNIGKIFVLFGSTDTLRADTAGFCLQKPKPRKSCRALNRGSLVSGSSPEKRLKATAQHVLKFGSFSCPQMWASLNPPPQQMCGRGTDYLGVSESVGVHGRTAWWWSAANMEVLIAQGQRPVG